MKTNRISVSLLAGFLSLGVGRAADGATPIEGAVLGQVRDVDTAQPVAGVTVVASGPEGDLAAISDAKGRYQFLALPIGHYTIRFHRNEVLAERDANVSVDQTVRVNIRLPSVPGEVSAVAPSYSAPAIDVGSSRIGTTFGADFIDNIPNQGADVASLIQKTPGAYNEDVGPQPSGGVSTGLSLAGGTGADNAYYLEGLNVTALQSGLLGTNLRLAFLEEAEVMSSGYGAEYGHALGGVVNMALKSGTNTWKGSAYSWVEPGGLAGRPQRILSTSTVLSGVTEPVYHTETGVEVGGPIIKDKLFIWLGFAPETSRSNFIQYADSFVDRNGDGKPDLAADGSPVVDPLYSRVIPGEATTQNYAGKLTWRLGSEHSLNLSLVGSHKDETFMRGANMDLLAGMSHEVTSRQDIIAHWQSAFFQRHWRIDASLGLHSEGYSRRSPFGDAESINDVNWINAPSLTQFNPQVAPYCATGSGAFNNCPVDGYQSGGYGIMRDISAFRLAGQIKSTNVFSAFGLHELKYGIDYELNQYDDKVWNSGVDGARGSVLERSSGTSVYSLYRLPYNDSIYNHAATELAQSPYYQDSIRGKTQALNQAAFIQESYLPVSNVTVNLGLRWEAQRLVDYNGNTALSIKDSLAPRLGIVYDPTKEGRSKIYAHFGRYYESIPMDLADRAFGGQGVVQTDFPSCPSGQSWRSCQSNGAYALNGDRLAVQPNIKGSYNNEVVLGAQYQFLRDFVVGGAVIYRWLGRVIEDTGGSVASGLGPSILANPGGTSANTMATLEQNADAWAAAANAPNATPATQAAADRARALANAAEMPSPERTYKAIQLTLSKRLARNWFFSGSYTYSRTMGNYAGLYDADFGKQLNPNNSSQYDYVELMANRYGPLPNDRPHVVHVDGYYQFVWGRHTLTPGLGFMGQSGQPITPLGNAPAFSAVYILPRGSAGRTPYLTQVDFHLAYRWQMTRDFSGEAFMDIFNLLNRRTVTSVDAYWSTDDVVMPAAPGTPLKDVPAADGSGRLATPNPNYLRPTSYQAPIAGRLGARVLF